MLQPSVKMIAMTMIWDSPDGYINYEAEEQWPTDSDELIEMAGRSCYQSWDRPRPETATNGGYINNIMDQRHYSVLEHSSVTFEITGVSTVTLGQLTRHRHLSYSVESGRFVDKSKNDFIEPDDYGLLSEEMTEILRETVDNAIYAYDRIMAELTEKGLARKQARQAARYVLPQGISTKIIVTGNMRAWYEFLQKRLSPGADEEIRSVARLILGQLKLLAPHTFADVKE